MVLGGGVSVYRGEERGGGGDGEREDEGMRGLGIERGLEGRW